MNAPDGPQSGQPQSGAHSDLGSSIPSRLDDEASEWVVRFALGQGSREDLSALKAWMARDAAHAEAFDRVSLIWTKLGAVDRSLADGGLESSRPLHRKELIAPRRSAMGRRAFLGGALAAAAAGAAVIRPPLDLWPSLTELAADFRTHPGEQRQLTLADQVLIDMNTRTSIAVHSSEGEARLLAGEAMISSPPQLKVPFILLVSDGRIVAMGAQYNVRIDSEDVCVTCVTGAIQVEQHRARAELTAGQQVRYSDGGISQPVIVDPAVVAAWRDGDVVFESTPVAEVIAEVNRYRPGRIILTNSALGRRLFNARLRIENIGNVVRQIELTFGARARELPGGIVLLG